MAMQKHWITCLFLVFIFFACTTRDISPLGNLVTPYHEVLNKHTVTHKYYGMEKVLYHTSMIYKSDEFRTAYVNEYARKYRLSEVEKQSMLAEELAEGQKHTDFVAIHYATDFKTATLDSSSKVWQFTLDNGVSNAERMKPENIIKLPGDKPVLEYFYPKLTQWSMAYLVRFPKTNTERLALHLDGVEDNLTFKW